MKSILETKTKFVLSSPPQRRVVFFRGTSRFLSFPALVYKMQYFEFPPGDIESIALHVAAVESHAPKPGSLLYGPILPHISMHNHMVCLGRTHFYARSPEALIRRMIGSFWSSRFIETEWRAMKHPDLSQWEFKTRSDPTWVPPIDFFTKSSIKYSKW